MDVLKFSWIKLTPTRALEQSCGKLEKAFFESTYRLTYITGLSTSERSTFYTIYSGTVKSIIGLFICGELWNLFSETNSLDGIISNINVTLIHLIAVYRYTNMVLNKPFYKKLATSTHSPYFDILTNKRKKLVKFWVLMNEKYLRLIVSLGSCTLAVWYVYPLVDDIQYNLTVALRLPFDYRNSTLYPITYLLYTVLANCFENIMTDCSPKGLPPKTFVMSNQFKKNYSKRFNNLVDQHIFILNNTMDLKKILSIPMLGQLVFSGMLICFAGYQVALTVRLSKAKLMMSILYLGYNVFQLFIFCRWCDEIKIQSENISQAVYSSSWERGVVLVSGVRSNIMLVAARAQKPLVLSAGGFFDLSLVTFTTLMKTSYSALTVLLRFRD